jgi:hypothetical protein
MGKSNTDRDAFCYACAQWRPNGCLSTTCYQSPNYRSPSDRVEGMERPSIEELLES